MDEHLLLRLPADLKPRRMEATQGIHVFSVPQCPLWFSFSLLSSVRRAGGQGFSVKGVSVEGFRAKVQVGGAELLGLAEEKISAGLEIKMQPLQKRRALRAREMRQHVHAEDAVETADIDRLGQVHGIECDQAAQSRLDQ